MKTEKLTIKNVSMSAKQIYTKFKVLLFLQLKYQENKSIYIYIYIT